MHKQGRIPNDDGRLNMDNENEQTVTDKQNDQIMNLKKKK